MQTVLQIFPKRLFGKLWKKTTCLISQLNSLHKWQIEVFRYLKKEFFQYYNATPGKWLTQKRLELAKSYLEAGNKNISDVASMSGFENLSHFSRVFKVKYGVSPLKFNIE